LKVKVICATSLDGFIAKHSNEKISWSQDLALFKKQTMNKYVIMGSNTYQTLEKPLKGRKIIVPSRTDSPKNIIKELEKTEKECIIAGGGITNSRFVKYITDIYITPHPIILGNGIKLFAKEAPESKTVLEKMVAVPGGKSIYQYQFQIIK
tara:strand:+ start:582 stop:1034 length:453 start_codon:yes stop_codon:yes gene_type:complete